MCDLPSMIKTRSIIKNEQNEHQNASGLLNLTNTIWLYLRIEGKFAIHFTFATLKPAW